MRRRAILGAPAGALALLAVLAVFLGRPGAGAAFFAEPGGGVDAPGAGIRLDQRPVNAVVLQTPAYRLTIAKRNGALLELVDRGSGLRVVRGTNGCEWGIAAVDDPSYVGGCVFAPDTSSRFSYRWDKATTTLTMTYTAGASADRHVDAVVTLHAQRSYFDLHLTLQNHASHVIQTVNFPADLYEDVNLVQSGYAPNFLPGVRFGPAFFRRIGNDVLTYPSRWAFADYLALDLGGAHLAIYSVNPAPAPLAPVDLGFVRNPAPVPCSGPTFCVTHAFETWIGNGDTWASPVMRVRVGEPVEQSILDYRSDNGIGAYPSLAAKVGARLESLSRAPLVKADLEKGVPAFKNWPQALERLPAPVLIHPVGFGPGGFDATDPDLLPPDSHFGTLDEFLGAVGAAHTHGDLVMPYLNVSWWSPQSPTIQSLPPPLTPAALSVHDNAGVPGREQFGEHDGFIVSPSVPFVRDRARAEVERWGTTVPADCLFFDQIGARPWRRDFNPASSSPLGYDDAWLSLFAPYADRCLMVEDGWDRLAASFSGFHGGLLLMEREHLEPDTLWGAGNWQPYPLADWLLHDKVLLYQHDLYEGTMTADPEVLTWNEAFGFVLSYDWAAGLDGPWLAIASAFQRALGPHYAGVALTGFRELAPSVTRSEFGTYSVVANWSGSPYELDGYKIAPKGFLARTGDNSLVAGAFADVAGTQYRIVEGGKTTFAADLPG